MADYRKPKYSGSLNLAPECGPVLIELDSVAKTATASLEDPASQYTLAGGGALEYVIPEQTVTFQNNIATLQNLNTSILEDQDRVIAKTVVTNPVVTSYQQGIYCSDDDEISFAPSEFGSIINGEWYMEVEDGMQITISAIRGF